MGQLLYVRFLILIIHESCQTGKKGEGIIKGKLTILGNNKRKITIYI